MVILMEHMYVRVLKHVSVAQQVVGSIKQQLHRLYHLSLGGIGFLLFTTYAYRTTAYQRRPAGPYLLAPRRYDRHHLFACEAMVFQENAQDAKIDM